MAPTTTPAIRPADVPLLVSSVGIAEDVADAAACEAFEDELAVSDVELDVRCALDAVVCVLDLVDGDWGADALVAAGGWRMSMLLLDKNPPISPPMLEIIMPICRPSRRYLRRIAEAPMLPAERQLSSICDFATHMSGCFDGFEA